MSDSPLDIPTGPSPITGESRSEKIVAIVSAMMALASLVLLVRIWTRFRIQGIPSGADEWSILASWAFSMAFTINVCLQTRHGLGKHTAELTADMNPTAALELFFYGEATYYITVSLTKISILFLYLKVIPHQGYRIFSWIMMVFVALTGFTCVVAGIFQCNPIRRAWHPADVPGTCFNQVALYLANAGLNILQDLIIYFLPVRTLWNLQLPRKQRIALIIVFVVGAFVCLTGILRLESLTMASVSEDPTWDNYGAAIWSSIESNVGIVCASLVHLKPLLARYTPSLLGIRQNTRLADERSGKEGGGAVDNSKLSSSNNSRSMGARSAAKSKSKQPFGILTEMELEDRYNEEAAIVRRPAAESESQTNLKAVTVSGSSSDDGDGYYRTEEGSRDGDRQQQAGTGIQKTTQFTISYEDRGGGTYPQRVSDVGRGF